MTRSTLFDQQVAGTAAEITHDKQGAHSPAFGGLAEVVGQETRGLDEFVGVLERQRAAVAEGNRQALDESVEDLDRLLLRLAKLRAQRQRMVDHLSGDHELVLRRVLDSERAFLQSLFSDGPPVRAIDEQVGTGRMSQALRQARRLIEHERGLLSHAS